MATQHIKATQIGIAGAIYCATDMIIMEKFKDINSKISYLKVTVTIDDVIEKSMIYQMNKLPAYLEKIYNYVDKTSVLDYNIENDMYTLYGDHIGRLQDYKFALGCY